MSRASVPSSMRSNLVITPIVRTPESLKDEFNQCSVLSDTYSCTELVSSAEARASEKLNELYFILFYQLCPEEYRNTSNKNVTIH